jgi:hypothetical protein
MEENMLLYILMALAAVLMLVAAHYGRAHRALWGRPVAGAAGCLAIVCALLRLWGEFTPPPLPLEQLAAWHRVQFSQTGKHLAAAAAGARVLVIAPSPFGEHGERMHSAMVDGLQTGFAGELELAATEMLPGPDGDAAMIDAGFGMGPTAAMFDEMIAGHPECDPVLSTVGLPMDVGSMQIWRQPIAERPALVVVNGDVSMLRRALSSGAVMAAVAHHPEAVVSDPFAMPPADAAAAFDTRYLLVTTANVDDLAARYPGLFVSPE